MAELAVVIFGGPNGSGKSTITKRVRESEGFPEHYVNADDIAQRLKPADESVETPEAKQAREVRAMHEAEAERIALIEQRESFAFETVMSHPGKLAIIDHAQRAGYTVALYFVSTCDPQINIARVAQRVAQGGHDVDPKKIVERYHRALSLLPGAVERADVSLVFDNSDVDGEAILVTRVVEGKLEVMTDTPPDYYRAALIDPYLTERPTELANVREKLQKELLGADLVGGEYNGEIVHVGAHFVVQVVQGAAILHDAAVLDACKAKVQQGAFCAIRYEHGQATSEIAVRELPGVGKAAPIPPPRAG
jgi:predicted ABC-type ATPase